MNTTWACRTEGFTTGWKSRARVSRSQGKATQKKDKGQSIRFKEELAGHLAELGLEAQKPFRLRVVDEHRYGLISTLRRCWTLRGVRPTAPYQTKYQWGYVYGGLEVMEGPSEFLYRKQTGNQHSSLHFNNTIYLYFPTTEPSVSSRLKI